MSGFAYFPWLVPPTDEERKAWCEETTKEFLTQMACSTTLQLARFTVEPWVAYERSFASHQARTSPLDGEVMQCREGHFARRIFIPHRSRVAWEHHGEGVEPGVMKLLFYDAGECVAWHEAANWAQGVQIAIDYVRDGTIPEDAGTPKSKS